jgi:hypothetical protein
MDVIMRRPADGLRVMAIRRVAMAAEGTTTSRPADGRVMAIRRVAMAAEGTTTTTEEENA